MTESPQHHGDLLRLVAQLRVMRAASPHKAAECDLLLAKLAPHVDAPSLPQGGGAAARWGSDAHTKATGVGATTLTPVAFAAL